jgi:hypothetical protein
MFVVGTIGTFALSGRLMKDRGNRRQRLQAKTGREPSYQNAPPSMSAELAELQEVLDGINRELAFLPTMSKWMKELSELEGRSVALCRSGHPGSPVHLTVPMGSAQWKVTLLSVGIAN